MNSNQRSQGNNQTSNGGNEKSVNSARGGTTENYSGQSSAEGTGLPGGGNKQADPAGAAAAGSGRQARSGGGGEGAGMQAQNRAGGDPVLGQGRAGTGATGTRRGNEGAGVAQQNGEITGGNSQLADDRLAGRRPALGSDDLARGADSAQRASSGEQGSGGWNAGTWASGEGGSAPQRAARVEPGRPAGDEAILTRGSNEHGPLAGGGGEASSNDPATRHPAQAGTGTGTGTSRGGSAQPAGAQMGGSRRAGGSAGMQMGGRGAGAQQPGVSGGVDTAGGSGARQSGMGSAQGGAAGAARAASSQLGLEGRQLSGSTDSQNVDSTSRMGTQTAAAAAQYDDVANQRYSNDSSGGLQRSPAGKHTAQDTDMNDTTGMSNSANRQELDLGTKQVKQSSVGRRDDMTQD